MKCTSNWFTVIFRIFFRIIGFVKQEAKWNPFYKLWTDNQIMKIRTIGNCIWFKRPRATNNEQPTWIYYLRFNLVRSCSKTFVNYRAVILKLCKNAICVNYNYFVRLLNEQCSIRILFCEMFLLFNNLLDWKWFENWKAFHVLSESVTVCPGSVKYFSVKPK